MTNHDEEVDTKWKQGDTFVKTKAMPSWLQNAIAAISTQGCSTTQGSKVVRTAGQGKAGEGASSTMLNSSNAHSYGRHSDSHIKTPRGATQPNSSESWAIISSTTAGSTWAFSPCPALEYPLLHLLTRHVPSLFEALQSFYTFRWWISYPLQRRVVLSRPLHHLHIYITYGELLLLLPYYIAVVVGALYAFLFPSVHVTGRLSRYTLIAALMFSQRNSFITLFLGIPVDRKIFYHKLAGRVAGVTGMLHTVAYGFDPRYHSNDTSSLHGTVHDMFINSINASGTIMAMTLVAMIISSIGPIRRRMFEVFYYLHLVFVVVFVVCTYFHTGWMVPSVAMATIGLDWFVRSIIMARWLYPKNATIKIMTETVVELTFPRTDNFQYNPGQYVYIAIPEISPFQWHPFSIVSSPNEPSVKLLIRKLGNWTTALHDLAKKKSQYPFSSKDHTAIYPWIYLPKIVSIDT
jgi:Ferric reductase like transmembrane component/FAD-binding domain